MSEALVFEPQSDDFQRNIIARYRRFLAEDPVHKTPDGRYLLTRYKDVHFACNDANLFERMHGFTSTRHPPGAFREWATDNFVGLNPPDHTVLRKAMMPAFSPKGVAALESTVASLCDELLEKMPKNTSFDLLESFAVALPLAVICRMMGIPRADEAFFHKHTTAMMRSIEFAGTPEHSEKASESAAALRDYILAVAKKRETDPGEDIISTLVRNEASSGMTRLQSVHAAMSLLIAGHETTMHLIGNGLVALLQNPDQIKIMRDDPSVIPNAVEEMLRFDPPVYTIYRSNKQAVEFGGVPVPAHSFLLLALSSANRDPEIFPDPDRFDVRRANANRHVSFSGGIHTCIGLQVARLETRTAFRKLLERFPRIEQAGEIVPRPGVMFHGCNEIPIKVAA